LYSWEKKRKSSEQTRFVRHAASSRARVVRPQLDLAFIGSLFLSLVVLLRCSFSLARCLAFLLAKPETIYLDDGNYSFLGGNK
jgi:hypothetical protein